MELENSIFLIIKGPWKKFFFYFDFFRCSISCCRENNKLIVQYLKALFHLRPVTQCYWQYNFEKLFRSIPLYNIKCCIFKSIIIFNCCVHHHRETIEIYIAITTQHINVVYVFMLTYGFISGNYINHKCNMDFNSIICARTKHAC